MSVLTSMKKTTRSVEKTLLGEAQEADLLDTLKEEHELVRDLLGRLTKSGKAAERKALLRQIKANLVPHVRAEEKVLYDAILALKDKEARQDGEEGYIEHSLADRTLKQLENIKDAMSAEFSAAAKVLKELVEHHVKEEEGNVWSDARENFPVSERRRMNARYLAEKKKIRVH